MEKNNTPYSTIYNALDISYYYNSLNIRGLKHHVDHCTLLCLLTGTDSGLDMSSANIIQRTINENLEVIFISFPNEGIGQKKDSDIYTIPFAGGIKVIIVRYYNTKTDVEFIASDSFRIALSITDTMYPFRVHRFFYESVPITIAAQIIATRIGTDEDILDKAKKAIYDAYKYEDSFFTESNVYNLVNEVAFSGYNIEQLLDKCYILGAEIWDN